MAELDTYYLAMRVTVIVFAVLSGLTNLFLIITILMNPVLRRSVKHILIVILSVILFIIGVFTGTMLSEIYANSGIWNKAQFGCDLYLAIEGIGYIGISIFALMICIICFDYCLWKMGVAVRPRAITGVGLTIAVCILSIVVLISIMMEGQDQEQLASYTMACFILPENYQTALNVLYFIPQAALMIVMVLVVIVMFQGRRNQQLYDNQHSNEQEDDRTSFPVDILLVAIVTFVFHMPFTIFLLGQNDFTFYDNQSRRKMQMILGRLSDLPYFLVPLIWIINSFTRHQIFNAVCCRNTTRQSQYTMSEFKTNSAAIEQ